jgi:hypothetical protein
VSVLVGSAGDWEPARWWRVVTESGAVWCETSSESEARAELWPGYTLLRLWRRTEQEWRTC